MLHSRNYGLYHATNVKRTCPCYIIRRLDVKQTYRKMWSAFSLHCSTLSYDPNELFDTIVDDCGYLLQLRRIKWTVDINTTVQPVPQKKNHEKIFACQNHVLWIIYEGQNKYTYLLIHTYYTYILNPYVSKYLRYKQFQSLPPD